MDRLPGNPGIYIPGLLACMVCAMAAGFLSDHYGGPIMLFALLLGIAFNFLNEDDNTCAPGIRIASTSVLRVGVALLGARITLEQVTGLGIVPVLLIIGLVAASVLFGTLMAHSMKLDKSIGVLTGGAVGICGVSAALAISSVLPRGEDNERYTLFAVVGVTALSTLAMIFYPILVSALGLTDGEAGFFLGATIHDVAQVIGAGYSISPESGDIATYTKLLRVAMLLPVVFLVSMIFRAGRAGSAQDKSAAFPMFLVFFVLIMLATSSGYIPSRFVEFVVDASRACLVVAVAAIGMKTSLGELKRLGSVPVMLMVSETVFLALLAALLLVFGLV
jgi:uncharacterized integral membrane protein (TIGR00698 family)